MYFPILRGKRFEFLAVRECKEKISASKMITPIFEPVNDNSSDLLRCLNILTQEDIDHIVICNPQRGDYLRNQRSLSRLIDQIKEVGPKTKFAFWLHEETPADELSAFSRLREGRSASLIHAASYQNPIELLDITEVDFDYHFFLERGVRCFSR